MEIQQRTSNNEDNLLCTPTMYLVYKKHSKILFPLIFQLIKYLVILCFIALSSMRCNISRLYVVILTLAQKGIYMYFNNNQNKTKV